MTDKSPIVCPAGYSCPGNTVNPIPCAIGTYSIGGNKTCSKCPKGGRLDVEGCDVNCSCIN